MEAEVKLQLERAQQNDGVVDFSFEKGLARNFEPSQQH